MNTKPCTCNSPACRVRIARELVPFCQLPRDAKPVQTTSSGYFRQ